MKKSTAIITTANAIQFFTVRILFALFIKPNATDSWIYRRTALLWIRFGKRCKKHRLELILKKFNTNLLAFTTYMAFITITITNILFVITKTIQIRINWSTVFDTNFYQKKNNYYYLFSQLSFEWNLKVCPIFVRKQSFF
jgi:hypothetical protein